MKLNFGFGDLLDGVVDLTDIVGELQKISDKYMKNPKKAPLPSWGTSRKKTPEKRKSIPKPPVKEETPEDSAKEKQTALEDIRQEKAPKRQAAGGGLPLEKPEAKELRKAVVWAEILGEPKCKKRRKRGLERRYGNQGYDSGR